MDPEPFLELHPRLAARLGLGDGTWATVESRRGAITLRARVVGTIRPDTVFVPYHWPGRRSINQLTIAAQDPISKIPEFKACAVRLRPATAEEAARAAAGEAPRGATARAGGGAPPAGLAVVRENG
jgi:assimilatory nitrate reductase catalytic subunit